MASELIKSNVFDEKRLESGGKEALPDSIDPSWPCPRCQRYNSFARSSTEPQKLTNTGSWGSADELERVTVLYYQGCNQGVLVVEEAYIGGGARRDSGNSGVLQWRGIFWWPSPGMQTAVCLPTTPSMRVEAVRSVRVEVLEGAIAPQRRRLTRHDDRPCCSDWPT